MSEKDRLEELISLAERASLYGSIGSIDNHLTNDERRMLKEKIASLKPEFKERSCKATVSQERLHCSYGL